MERVAHSACVRSSLPRASLRSARRSSVQPDSSAAASLELSGMLPQPLLPPPLPPPTLPPDAPVVPWRACAPPTPEGPGCSRPPPGSHFGDATPATRDCSRTSPSSQCDNDPLSRGAAPADAIPCALAGVGSEARDPGAGAAARDTAARDGDGAMPAPFFASTIVSSGSANLPPVLLSVQVTSVWSFEESRAGLLATPERAHGRHKCGGRVMADQRGPRLAGGHNRWR
jgi:hypothetical protein